MTKGVQKEGSRSRAGVFTANGVVILYGIALNVHYPVFENTLTVCIRFCWWRLSEVTPAQGVGTRVSECAGVAH